MYLSRSDPFALRNGSVINILSFALIYSHTVLCSITSQGDWMKTFLRYEATRATPLKDDSHMGTTQSCRLHSGQIAIWGSLGIEEPLSLGIEEPLRIHLFHKDGTDTGNALRTTCDHNYDTHLLSIIISSRNYLAVSCRTCGNIRLKNLDQFFEEPTEAFNQDKMAGPMCTGPDGIMYMACRGNGEILVLDCTKLSFVCKHLIGPYTPIDPNQICFVSLHDIFVLGSTVDRKLCAVTRNGHKFWEIDAVQNQGDFNPEGLVYLPNHDLLLVGDLEARKIYILASKYGLCMNVLPADKEVENVHALHLGDNHVIARCRTTSGCVKLYFYKVSFDLLFFLNLPRFYEYCKERNYFNYYHP